MKRLILNNGIKVVYKKTNSELTSICIALEAGAAMEDKLLGVAHATEHMIYKGTKKRSEDEINKQLNRIFGFQNAMTNYPYAIYYGTLLKDEFEDAVELFSDILINPNFDEKGFKEEMDVIIEELKEWDEELEQYCEDKLFINSFNSNRLKYPIIGLMDHLKRITISDIKEFYEQYYIPGNLTLAIVTSLSENEVMDILNRYFGTWIIDKNVKLKDKSNEKPNAGLFKEYKENINTCKVQIIAPLNNLSNEELNAFRIFNAFFGEGVNSKLFDVLRTQNGLIYDVITKISSEKHISLYKVLFNISKDNLDLGIELFKNCVDEIESYEKIFTKDKIEELAKSIKIKKLFREEQSIVLAKELSTYELMFGDYKIYDNMTEEMDKYSEEFIISVAKKVLTNLSIQIVSPK